MSLQITHAPERSRYEATRDGVVLGFAEYQRTDDLMVFTHTEVDAAAEGQGVASALIKTALDDVRAQGLKALPICPFVIAYMKRHPEYAELDYRATRAEDPTS